MLLLNLALDNEMIPLEIEDQPPTNYCAGWSARKQTCGGAAG
jgi:hypothetical protein